MIDILLLRNIYARYISYYLYT